MACEGCAAAAHCPPRAQRPLDAASKRQRKAADKVMQAVLTLARRSNHTGGTCHGFLFFWACSAFKVRKEFYVTEEGMLVNLLGQPMKSEREMRDFARLYRGGYFQEASNFSNCIADIDLNSINVFRQVCKQSERDCQEMSRRTNAGERYTDYVLDMMVRFPMTTATIEDTCVGRVITQGKRPHLFRGENAEYPTSVATLDRKLRAIDRETERKQYSLVAFMRMAAFAELAHSFEVTARWLESYDVDFPVDPLAQHYGLDTPALDFTDDFDTALFFATCKWDPNTGAWRPLDKADIDSNHSHGIVFHIPRSQAEFVMIMESHLGSTDTFDIAPIGFQPFQRCYMQHGYACWLASGDTLQDNRHFEQLRFKQSVELSREVFELMDCGRKVFPYEGLSRAMGQIEQIKNAWSFSDREFQEGYRLAGGDLVFESQDKAKHLLSSGLCMGHNISIDSPHPCFTISDDLRKQINVDYADYNLETVSGYKYPWTKPRLY